MDHNVILNNMHEKLFGTRPFIERVAQSGTGDAVLSVRVTDEIKAAYDAAPDKADQMRAALEGYARAKGWLS